MSPRRAKAIADHLGENPAAALHEHLVEVARRLLGSSTISRMTTREIARSAGVSEGVLYNYFGDKADLILAGVRRHYDGLVARFEAQLPIAGNGTVEGNLTTIASAAQEMHAELMPILAGLLNEPALLHRFIDEVHDGPIMPMTKVRAYLAEEQELGRVSAAIDPGAATAALMGSSLMFALGRHLMPNGPGPLGGQRLPEIVTALMNGLRPEGDRPEQPA